MMTLIIYLLIHFGWIVNAKLSSRSMLLVVLLAIINGFAVSSLLHNASHSNVKGKLFNRVVGEYCGYWVLYGFSNFCLVHILHHKFSDEELDPVSPKGMSFIVFLSAPMRYMIKAARKYLFKVHGKSANYNRIMIAQTLIFHVNLILRLTIWYLLLGKTFFFSFYLPGFLTIVSIFAHINYVCHQQNEKGTVDILNIDHNIYYKITNFFTMGGYYHKNHHLSMTTFNPKYLKTVKS